jgi:thioredoxin-related protein
MFLKKIIAFVFVLCSYSVMAQQLDKAEIHWMSFPQAVALNKANPKKIFIDVYTQWCGWCKRMDASTYKDTSVIKYMNEKFYAVKLDAETKDTIRLDDKVFVFKPEYKANEIAIALLNQQMSYPTSVYLDEQFSMLGPSPGYQTSEQLLPQLKYFAENIYKTKTWETYRKEVFGQ